MVDIQEILEIEIPFLNSTILEFMIAVIVTIIVAIVMLKVVLGILRNILEKSGLPRLLAGLMTRLIRIFLIVVILLVFLSLIGFDTSAIVLALSAIMGLMLAFGMQDSTNNFFSGVWIGMIRPFGKHELVEVAGYKGKVMTVGIMVTELLQPDNVYITIPNKVVWGSAIVNHSRMPKRRGDTDVSIAYGSDVKKAYDVAMRVMRENPKVLKDPTPSIYMTELADSSVNLQLRPWTKSSDYLDIVHEMREAFHEEMPKAGIEIPFPQMDVHVISPAGAKAEL